MGGDDLYSSLFILKIRGFHLKLLQDDQNDIPSEKANSIDQLVCKLVSGISYLKFLVTIVVEDSVIALKTYRVTVKSLKIHPESMRNGLVNLNVEVHCCSHKILSDLLVAVVISVALTLQVENARAEQLETNIALRVDKVTTNAIIQGRNYTTLYSFHYKL